MRSLLCLALCLATLPALADDGRTPLKLSADDIAAVQDEMRAFMLGVQQITDRLADHDMKGVAAAAAELGQPGNSKVPMATRMSFPLEFRAMGRATHAGFYKLAADAREMGDPDACLKQLSETLQNCNACHGSFRLVEKGH